MAKNINLLSPAKYIQTKGRLLPIEACYIGENLEDIGETQAIIVRRHAGGTYTVGCYLLDIFCCGVKNSFYRFSISESEKDELLQQVSMAEELKEIPYVEFHNWIYGAIEFAKEAGIHPCKEFALTRYLLEEDDDNVELIEYEYGQDGKHFLICETVEEARKYMPTLLKNIGDDFYFMVDENTFAAKDWEDVRTGKKKSAEPEDRDEDYDDEEEGELSDTETINVESIFTTMVDPYELLQAEFLICGEDICKMKTQEEFKKWILKHASEWLLRLEQIDLDILNQLINLPEGAEYTLKRVHQMPLIGSTLLVDSTMTSDGSGTVVYKIHPSLHKVLKKELPKILKREDTKIITLHCQFMRGVLNIYGALTEDDFMYVMKSTMMDFSDYLYNLGLDAPEALFFDNAFIRTAMLLGSKSKKFDYVSPLAHESIDYLYGELKKKKVKSIKLFTIEEYMAAGAQDYVLPNPYLDELRCALMPLIDNDSQIVSDVICYMQRDFQIGNNIGAVTKNMAETGLIKSVQQLNNLVPLMMKFYNAQSLWELKGNSPEDMR